MNMTKGYSILLLMAALPVMTGCMADDESLQTGQAPVVELTTSVVQMATEAPTRAAATLQETQLEQGEVFTVAFDGATVEQTTYRTTDALGNTECTGNGKPSFGSAPTVTAHGYYPSKPSGTFSVLANQSSNDNYKHSDLMYATTTITKANPTGSLTFARKMAKIVVNATLGAGIGEIRGVELVGGYRTVNVTNATSCTLGTTLSDAISAQSPVTVWTGTHTTGTLTCAALLPPQTVGSALSPANFLKVTTDKGPVTFSLAGKTFESGNLYIYDANISLASIGTVAAINAWTEHDVVAANLIDLDPMRLTPLTLEAKEDNPAKTTVTFNNPLGLTIEYSLDGGVTWKSSSDATISKELSAGDRIQFRGNNATYATGTDDGQYSYISCTDGNCYVYGNIMSLVNNSFGFALARTLEGTYTFYKLFSSNTYIKNHASKQLVLPATTLAAYCYSSMFYGCTGLESAPELPATTLASYCYSSMFVRCTSLTTAPELPATTLANNCYQNMFSGCTGLTSVPASLPATTLAERCYFFMFSGCTSLTTAPTLLATTLAQSCCYNMFAGCTSLTTAPALPATTLAQSCYQFMFSGCTSLATAPELPATTLANNCYEYMFQNCTSLTTAPALPATTLANYCYSHMFYRCTGLTSAPTLPATTLEFYCYSHMFEGCTSLTTAPALPATTLAFNCYFYMFNGCTNLNSVTCLATNISAASSHLFWLNGVAATGTFTKAPDMNDWPSGDSGIPSGWTVQDATAP